MPTKRRVPRPPRPGTKRAKVVQLMSRPGGATLDQIRRATKWDGKTALDGIRLVRVDCGYSVTRSGDTFRIGRAGARKRARPGAVEKTAT